MKYLYIALLFILNSGLWGCADNSQNPGDIVIENEEMRLTISSNGIAKSLLYKPANEECLVQDAEEPAFSMVIDINYSPYDDVLKANLITMGEHEFTADSVYREGDNLIAHFGIVDINAIIHIDIEPEYIQFSIEDFVYSENKPELVTGGTLPMIKEMWFLRLPVRERTRFGGWLNVVWDDKVAVNLLSTGPFMHIGSEKRRGHRMLKAGSTGEVKLKETGAALMTTSPDNLLNHIARVEENFNLPRGAKNRQREISKLSSYWSGDAASENVTPENIDRHIAFAKKAGIRTFYVYYTAFSTAPGHYEWRPEYPNEMDDLRAIVKKIEDAGMVPGIHIHYNKAGISDKYVTPVPDSRLHLRRFFTLAAPLGKDGKTVFVEENPAGSMMEDGRRMLKIGDELISYSSYSTTSPFKFTGCERGVLESNSSSHPKGAKFGILNVDSWPIFVLLDQNTDIQDELAERLAEIYREAGFKFVYFDGAEDVHPPHWFNCSNAQWRVYRQLEPEPLFAGGAAMSHFGWHILSRGNHYDSHRWPPEEMKQAIRDFPAAAAPRMADNFTSTSFGRYRYFVPGENTIGIQPDMFEYLAARAAAWDSPWILKGDLHAFEAHPRTPDNLEVVKRWEDAKAQNWLTAEQKQMLRNTEQEHTLLIDEEGEFELVPYEQIVDVADGQEEIRAFVFERDNEWYVVYWHTSDSKALELPVNPEEITLLEELGRETEAKLGGDGNSVIVPVNHRRYVKSGTLSKNDWIAAFQKAGILNREVQ
ncbi:MAG: hypothetical protein ACOCVA_00365 [Prolixibacteraceae bacterium]